MTITNLAPASEILPWTVCVLVPQRIPWGAGWYLVAANTRVEAGPFLTEDTAVAVAEFLDDHAMGVHPGPWLPRYSRLGLIVGSRARDRRAERKGLQSIG